MDGLSLARSECSWCCCGRTMSCGSRFRTHRDNEVAHQIQSTLCIQRDVQQFCCNTSNQTIEKNKDKDHTQPSMRARCRCQILRQYRDSVTLTKRLLTIEDAGCLSDLGAQRHCHRCAGSVFLLSDYDPMKVGMSLKSAPESEKPEY